MAQITLYVDEQTRERLEQAAARRAVSQSRYVAELIRRATEDEWPEEVRALAGSLRDFPNAEALRAGQADDVARLPW